MRGRTNLKIVTPAAERKRRSRAKKAEGAGQTAPVALVRDHVTVAATVPPARPTIASLAAGTLTLPLEDVSFDDERRVISVQFRPIRPMLTGFDLAPAIGEILRMSGWPVRSTVLLGETIEIRIGEAA